MITVRKANYSLSDLRDLRNIILDGYENFLNKKCTNNITCEICDKYYLCEDILSTLNHLQKEIEKRTPPKN